MNKEEILERNRKSTENAEEDEREEYISGKAGITAKITFSLVAIILAMYKRYKNIPNSDVWSLFMTYYATEFLYKSYYLKNKKLFLLGIFFSILAIFYLIYFIIYICK